MHKPPIESHIVGIAINNLLILTYPKSIASLD